MSQTKANKPIKRWQERGWQTYEDAYAYFRQIIHRAIETGFEPGQPLPPEHEEILRWLLQGDPTFPEDEWPNIAYFTLHRPYDFDKNKIGFAVALVHLLGGDGAKSRHHFSVRVCLGHVPRKSRVSDAFKAEIEPELAVARKQFSGGHPERPTYCPETREPLSEANLALDYLGPGFKQILEAFLLTEKIPAREVELDDEGIADRALATRWQAYFAVNAKIIGVSKRGLKIRNERRKNDPFWGLST